MSVASAHVTEPSIEQIEERFASFLRQRSLPFTVQRRQVLQGIFERRERFTAEGLWRSLLEKDESTSRATVFRTIGLFRDSGIVRELEVSGGERFFYPKTTDHDDSSHLICTDCSKVIEFQDEHMALLEDYITRHLGFKSSRKILRIEASCEELRSKGECSKAACKR